MARPLRVEFPFAVYHVTSRGNARADIFLDDADRRTFLNTLSSVVLRYNWICHAYCLMGNHYHLIIETPDANLSQGMRQLNGAYTQTFNKRHGRVGHISQGRFRAVVVQQDSHLPGIVTLRGTEPHPRWNGGASGAMALEQLSVYPRPGEPRAIP
ncbi:transposase [Geomonas subterranea]|nr:transposase [Geomonas fuzhouensis]